jgi:hypothetical protein
VAGDEDFDVEEWERRLLESPSFPLGPPRVRTRRPRPEPRTDPRHPSSGSAFGGPDDPDRPVDDLDPFDDPFAEPGATEAVTVEGFPAFEHNQWTVEGEIERFGAFGRGAARARGWKRSVALALVALILVPIALQILVVLIQVVR